MPAMVGGFCLAVMRMNQLSPNLKIIVLLKSHVYGPITSEIEDISKYPQTVAYLSWEASSLTELVKNRLAWVTGETPDTSLRVLFAVKTEREARGLLDGISGQVRNGPRDLIYWIDRALARSKSPDGRIGQSDLEHVRKEVGLRSFKELESAYHSRYPGIAEMLRIIFRDRRTFTRRDLRKYIETLLTNNVDMKNLARSEWMQNESSDTLPKRLFEIGALSFRTGASLILPYMKDYTPDQFESATSVSLCPILEPVLG